MPLFTFISLMIGVFGATITVIMVIKTFGDRRLGLYIDQSELLETRIRQFSKGKTGENCVGNLVRVLKFCAFFWRSMIVIPIVVFAIWAFSTALFISGDKCSSYFQDILSADSEITSNPTPSSEGADAEAENESQDNNNTNKHAGSKSSMEEQGDGIRKKWFFQPASLKWFTRIQIFCTLGAAVFLVIAFGIFHFVKFVFKIVLDESEFLKDMTGD